jgi:hypothetical protein
VTTLPELEPWVKKSLQGITYWIGHRHCLYEHYPLGESAFVAELCNLIFAHLDKTNLTLRCEVLYRDLAVNLPPETFPPAARADIVVSNKSVLRDAVGRPANVIEVKRGTATRALIHTDLRRLADIRRHTKNCRTYLFVVCESYRPPAYITPEGVSVGGEHAIIDDADACYRVRRTYKAAHAFKNKESSQYACCLEVFDRPPVTKKLTLKKKIVKRDR